MLWPTVAWMVPGLLLGGWLGSRVGVAVPGGWLRAGVAAYCVLMALHLLRGRHAEAPAESAVPTGYVMSLAGVGIGAVSALVGIGGGSMTVPLLIARQVTPVRAVGTSSACGAAVGLGSALGYAVAVPAGLWFLALAHLLHTRVLKGAAAKPMTLFHLSNLYLTAVSVAWAVDAAIGLPVVGWPW